MLLNGNLLKNVWEVFINKVNLRNMKNILRFIGASIVAILKRRRILLQCMDMLEDKRTLVTVDEKTRLVNTIDLEAFINGYRSINDVSFARLMCKIAEEGAYKKANNKAEMRKLLQPIKEKMKTQIKQKEEKLFLATDRNNDFAKEVWDKGLFEARFDDMFEWCWNGDFSDIHGFKSKKKLKHIIYAKRPLKNKLYNSNFALVIFLIIFLLIQEGVKMLTMEELYRIANVSVLRVSMAALLIGWIISFWLKNNSKDCPTCGNIVFVPLIAMGLVALGWWFLNYMSQFMLIESWQISMINKVYGNEILTFLLWYVVIPFNTQRLEDCYTIQYR